MAHEGGSIDRLVSVSSTGGRTTVEGSANLRQTAVGTYVSGGLVASTIGFIGIAASVAGPTPHAGGLALSVGFLAAAYGGLRAILRKLSNTESAKLERVVHELADLTRREGADRPVPD